MMKDFPRKFLSLRDKSGAHRRSRSAPPTEDLPRPTSSEGHGPPKGSSHRRDASARSSRDYGKQEAARVAEVQRRLEAIQMTNVAAEHIKDVLISKYADGNPQKAVEFIEIEQKAANGVIVSYDPSVHMVGAENRESVTCYLDSLLFAMFSKLDAFECMLKNDFPREDARYRLVSLLRIWVNMLRSGKLVRTDLTKLIQEALAACGWSDAKELEQQDTSEAFAFLTETLQLPLLSLQVDLFHHGRKDDDDHKVVHERLLNLAVPPDVEGKGLKLEDCLEEYFNAQVDVSRDSEVARKSVTDDLRPSISHRSTVPSISEHAGEASSTVTSSPLELTTQHRSPWSSRMESLSPVSGEPEAVSPRTPYGGAKADDKPTTSDVTPAVPGASTVAERRTSTRARSTSVIQHVVLDENGRTSSLDDESMRLRAKRQGSTVVKAVTIPAWQFFRLIPWHAINSTEPQNDSDVATNFNQRPIVGICLKRYAMTEDGRPKRHNTYIDIPDSLRLPRFMMADDKSEGDPNGLDAEYKMVLQSVVCHRGESLQSGHYISYARVAPRLLTDNKRQELDPPPDYEEAQWVQFDDLDVERRVSYVDDIRQSLKDEMPYLLFYQVVPIVEVAAPSTTETEPEPPSYNDSRASLDFAPTTAGSSVEAMPSITVKSSDGYFDRKVAEVSVAASSAEPTSKAASENVRASRMVPAAGPSPDPTPRAGQTPSIRLSTEIERPSRREIGTPGTHAGTPLGGSPRPSMQLESTSGSPAMTPEAYSPALTPSDESTASRLSRAAHKFARGRQSRPASQVVDNRMMNRLSVLMKAPSKEPLVDPSPLDLTSNSHNSSHRPSMEGGIENGRTPEAIVEEDVEEGSESNLRVQQTHHRHGSHGKSKSRDKVMKTKTAQPDRECNVM